MEKPFDLSLTNTELYKGCIISETPGKLNLETPPAEATYIIGRNINTIVDKIPSLDRNEIILTGKMAIWAYLVVFHVVVHQFRRVYYDDGKGPILIAAHG